MTNQRLALFWAALGVAPTANVFTEGYGAPSSAGLPRGTAVFRGGSLLKCVLAQVACVWVSLWQSGAKSLEGLPAVTFNLLWNRRTMSVPNSSPGAERITGKQGLVQIEDIHTLFWAGLFSALVFMKTLYLYTYIYMDMYVSHIPQHKDAKASCLHGFDLKLFTVKETHRKIHEILNLRLHCTAAQIWKCIFKPKLRPTQKASGLTLL